MSGDPTAQADSSSTQAASEPPKPAKKPRSPVERVIVWGGILALLLLVAVQAHARFGYEWTLGNLQPLIDDDNESATPLALAEVDSHLVGFPSQSETEAGAKMERVYRWHGLGRSYAIMLSYNPTAEPIVVTGLVTEGAPEPPPPEMTDDESDDGEEELEEMENMTYRDESRTVAEGGPSGGGPRGGGFNPMDNDADGDGRLSREEAPERMRENFADIDTNQDDFVDEAEIEAIRARFREQFGGGRGGREGSDDRPQRPALEGAESTDESSEDAPEEGGSDGDASTADGSGEQNTEDSP